jgi:integrase
MPRMGIKVIGPRGEDSKKIVPPSKDDIRALIDAASEELQVMLLFAASTGARADEQWATRWRDVNFDKGELHIQLAAMLKAWKVKSQFSKSDDLIFPNRDGHHRSHDNLVKRQFLPLFDLIPTVKRLNWHGL